MVTPLTQQTNDEPVDPTEFSQGLGTVGGQEDEGDGPVFIGGFDQDFIDARPSTGEIDLGGYRPPVEDPYVQFDEWRLFQGKSTEYITGVQQRLIEAGFMNESHVRSWGVWNDGEASAMFGVMDVANGTGRSFNGVLTQSILHGGAPQSGGGSGGARPTIRLSNPEDLKAAFKQVARQQHGGVFVEDDQLDGMVTSFQDQERKFQLAAQRGGEVTSNPNAQTFAEGALEEADPGGADANRFQQMTRTLMSIVGEAGSV